MQCIGESIQSLRLVLDPLVRPPGAFAQTVAQSLSPGSSFISKIYTTVSDYESCMVFGKGSSRQASRDVGPRFHSNCRIEKCFQRYGRMRAAMLSEGLRSAASHFAGK